MIGPSSPLIAATQLGPFVDGREHLAEVSQRLPISLPNLTNGYRATSDFRGIGGRDASTGRQDIHPRSVMDRG